MGARSVQVLEAEIVNPQLTSAEGETESTRGWLSSPLALGLLRLAFFVVFLVAWEIAATGLHAEFWVSRPSLIGGRLVEWIRTGYLPFHLGITLQEMFWGFIFGASAGIAAGFLLGLTPVLGKLLDPFITSIYSLPKIALAPLFVLWFGIGLEMKIVIAAVTVFFLVFWNSYAGVRDVDAELVDVLRVMGAKQHHLLQKVILPGALSWIYVGLKLSIPYALIGAIVGEIVASNRGLGFVLQSTAGQFDTAGLFAALFVLMIVATLLNEVLNRSETHVLRWKRIGR